MTIQIINPSSTDCKRPAYVESQAVSISNKAKDKKVFGKKLTLTKQKKRTVLQDKTFDSVEECLDAVAQHRDRNAFKRLFELLAPKLKSFAMRNGVGTELAEEVVQETFIRIWRKAGQFDSTKASASTWIYTIARNQRIDLLRKRHRPEPDFEDPAFVPEAEPQPSDVITRDEEAKTLRNSINSLSPEQQAVLKLAFLEELPHVEVAERLKIPLGTVKSRIRLAMKHIRADIGDIR